MIIAHIRTSFAEAFFPRLSEWTPAGTIAFLGWILTVNPDLMFSTSSAAYDLMLSIASQPHWSLILMTLGAARLAVLLINGAWRRSPWARALMAFVSCFLWTQIMLSFLPVFGLAFGMSVGFLVTDVINVFRAMRDARTVDDAYAARSRAHVPD
ncbi:MAG: hypothetical protein M9955_16325 [Rhizobiaceae bacterium]|nr:hypothetical protein [Rhizobiaceae bacterium]